MFQKQNISSNANKAISTAPDELMLGSWQLARWHVGKWLYVWWLFSLFTGGLLGEPSVIRRNDSPWHSFEMWGGLVLAVAIVSLKWQRIQRTDISGTAMRIWIFITVFLCWSGFFAFYQFVNSRLDFSQPQTHKVKII